MDVDCSQILHLSYLVPAETCAAARATIRAAEIQAKAARYAGQLGLAAGFGAIVAGAIAYMAAILQVHLVRDQQLARRRAYARQVVAILSRAQEELAELERKIRDIVDSQIRVPGPIDLSEWFVTNIALLRGQLDPNMWENHALLGSKFLDSITKVYDSITDFISKIEHLRKNNSPTRALLELKNSVSETEFSVKELKDFIWKTSLSGKA